MPLDSDLTLLSSLFDPSHVTQNTRAFNESLIKAMDGQPRWFEVGAEKYRQMRWRGETPMAAQVLLPEGKQITLPSREPGRSIPCRVFKPAGKPRGIFYHIHGGGWVLQSEKDQDTMLKFLMDKTQLLIVSVGYRLAPEHPWPLPNEDCYDVAEHLIDNCEKEFGCPLLFMGGDSAGAHLSTVTLFHVLQSRPGFAFKGVTLNYGPYNLAQLLPSCSNFKPDLVLTGPIMAEYVKAYVPNTTAEQRRDKFISPFYADLSGMRLPPALFTVGTMDPLLDDSIMMSARWMANGAPAILKVYPGACHHFIGFPIDKSEQIEKALLNIAAFMNERS